MTHACVTCVALTVRRQWHRRTRNGVSVAFVISDSNASLHALRVASSEHVDSLFRSFVLCDAIGHESSTSGSMTS